VSLVFSSGVFEHAAEDVWHAAAAGGGSVRGRALSRGRRESGTRLLLILRTWSTQLKSLPSCNRVADNRATTYVEAKATIRVVAKQDRV